MLKHIASLCVAVCFALLASSTWAVAAPADEHGVLPGIDVLQQNNFAELADMRVGLITNHTGRNRGGISTVQLLHDAPNVELVALFSPEHGFEGKLDVSRIDDAQDQATGLKIFSLYGWTRRPTKQMLEGIDVLVFDIQDIGCRFYTYVSTMGEAMAEAAENDVAFVVLDRPNPIGGTAVAGPMLDAGRESFVAFHSMPVRHGMTTGELAMMFREELKLDLKLSVIKCEGWSRNQLWDNTGLLWTNPSPNMRSLTQALLYPGIGLIEYSNVSVGRGTDTPFEVVGAPWIDAREFAFALNQAPPAGVTFVPIEFTPSASRFTDEPCGGVNIIITDRASFEPLRTGFHVASTLQKLYADTWDAEPTIRLLGHERTMQAITEGNTFDAIAGVAEVSVDSFQQRRQQFLLYE